MNLDCRFDAICELYPKTGSVENGVNAFDSNGKPIDIDESKIKPVYEKKLAEYNSKKYKRDRAEQYPSIQDVVVALAEKEEGDDTMWQEITAKRQKVKADNPKPE